MRFSLLTLLASLLIAVTSAAAPAIKIVEAEGRGPSLNAAVEAAQRDAVEKAVGVLIGGETMVKNWELMSDRIISHSVGYIRRYEIIRRQDFMGGDVAVTIRAEVSQIIDQLTRDEQARELLLRWLNVPRVTLAIREDLTGDTNSTVASREMEAALIEAGFSVVRGGKSAGNGMNDTLDSLDPAGELLLVGEAEAHVGPTPAVMKRAGMISVQGEVKASLLLADTRDVLATRRRTVAAPHIDSTKAGARAISAAARSVADSLITDVLRVWALQKANSLPLEVVVSPVSSDDRSAIQEEMRILSGVRNVYERGWSDGTQTLMVEWEGTSGQMATELEGILLNGQQVHIRALSWGRIVLDIDQP